MSDFTEHHEVGYDEVREMKWDRWNGIWWRGWANREVWHTGHIGCNGVWQEDLAMPNLWKKDDVLLKYGW